MAYAVKTVQFEGPLDLLLDLIEKRKLSINDISLAEIADQYLEYLKKMEEFPLEEVAFFIGVASTLILIKSRSLMPGLELSEEEEKNIEDLEGRLKIYRRIKELSSGVQDIFCKNPLFARESFKGVNVGFVEPKNLDLEKLTGLLREIVNNFPIKEQLPAVEIKKVISLEDKILELTERIKNSLELSFSEFSNSEAEESDGKKVEVIVSFLAMLELVKQGIIMVKQVELFEQIVIYEDR